MLNVFFSSPIPRCWSLCVIYSFVTKKSTSMHKNCMIENTRVTNKKMSNFNVIFSEAQRHKIDNNKNSLQKIQV